MPYRITIEPSGHRFDVNEDETILQAALREGFTLPYGCRNGACGSCKGKVLQGSVDFGKYQPDTLKPEEIAEGKALFCVARPLSDLVLEAKEIRAAGEVPVRTLPCRVNKLQKLADDVMLMQLKLPANERLQFLAGQYIDFLLKDGKRRSYSIANPPHADEFIELHLRHVPGGRFTDHVFNEMKEKAILRFEGPHGSFYVREDSDKPIIFVAGGTGFAPIKGMLEHLFVEQSDRQMILYWGARAKKDIYLPELPVQWQQQHPNFSFIPVLSDPSADDRWQGRTGYVHQAVMQDFNDLSGFEAYVCGAPAMVEAARSGFIQSRALPQEAFFADSFVYQAD
jgi:CDP-4-dehydro-6-deoxyglucose reductase, E3